MSAARQCHFGVCLHRSRRPFCGEHWKRITRDTRRRLAKRPTAHQIDVAIVEIWVSYRLGRAGRQYAHGIWRGAIDE